MAGLLGTAAPLRSDVNLLVQVVILVLLFVGFYVVKRLKFGQHGYFMFFAVAVNLLSMIFVMLPSALSIIGGASLTFFTGLMALHSALGAVAEVWGIYIVAVWRFRRPGQSCFKLRNHMRVLMILWVMTSVLGFALYGLLYT